MLDVDAVINKNDNHPTRGFCFRGDDNRLRVYIPLATALMQRHWPGVWKNLPGSWPYAMKEFELCCMLDNWPTDGKEVNRRLEMLAWVLDCPLLKLHNERTFHELDS